MSVACSGQVEESPVRIVTLGDSITKGVRTGVTANETFAAIVESSLREKLPATDVVNVGIGGERTDQALQRLDAEIVSKKPRIVTIMYGTNDSYVDLGKTQSRLSVDEYRANLVKIVESLQKAGIQPVLMTEPRWGRKAKNGLDENPNDRLEKYVEACRSVAREHKLPLVDHFADWTKAEAEGADVGDWTTDQCHPNPEGHRRMAGLMVPILLEATKTKD